jgi:TetR/AcrR family transcriptional regulator, transcriptional repressor for nem operon
MRVSKEKAAEHRKQILNAAARLFRERGIGATGVDSITDEAGLTHGAVYSQFGSKEAIAIESIRLALQESRRTWQRTVEEKGRKQVLTAIVESYLSRKHRDMPGRGCLIAALGGDISRQPKNVREAFTEEFRGALNFLLELAQTDGESITFEDGLVIFASLAGAMMVARAVNDEALSDLVLKATSRWITGCTKFKRHRRARN